MKNKGVIDLYNFLNFGIITRTEESVLNTIGKIKCKTLQWWKIRNMKSLVKEYQEIIEGLNELKLPELVNAEKSLVSKEIYDKAFSAKSKTADDKKVLENHENYLKLLEDFDRQENVLSALEEESKLVITKIKVDDLPDDLDGEQMGLIEWMIE